jgi:uncharacterized protein
VLLGPATYSEVGPGFCEVRKIPILSGREFEDADQPCLYTETTNNICLGECRVSIRVYMKMIIPAVLCAVTVQASQTSTTSQRTGLWEGQMLLNGNWRFMEAQFGSGNPSEAKVDLPQERREFRDFEVEGNQLRWALMRGDARIRFDGRIDGSVIRGTSEQNGVTGDFQLVRVNRSSSTEDPGRSATYRMADGNLVTIVRFDFGDGIDRLALMDTKYGYWGMLLPTGIDLYMLAPSRSGRFPADVHIQFERDASGKTTGLTMTLAVGPPVSATRIDVYDTRAITFSNGGITLAGDVLLPRSKGSHPAVVMVHSSGNQSRNGPVGYFRLVANLFASNGFAVLVYDKRGVGKSTGSWPNATFEDLAGDVRSAVAALRAEPEIDKDHVGLWTLSQGGWIAPMVAASDPRLAFLTLVSGAATSPAQQEMDRVARVMQTNGFTQKDIDSARRYLRTFFDVVTGKQSWGTLQVAIPSVASEAWVSYVPRPQSEREAGWAPAPADLDPQPLLRRVRVPILTIHGAEDVDVPAKANSSLYATVSLHSGSRQRIIDRADHYMLLGITDPERESRRLDTAYLQFTVDWMKQAPRN